MRRFACAFACAFALLVSHGHAGAEEPSSAREVERARQHFQRGVAFYQAADYRSALVEFQEAYRVSPNYRVLFNVGQTCKELADYSCAVRSFRDYLSKGGGEIETPRRTEVESELQRLEGHVAVVDVMVNEPDATLTAEGERRIELGRSPLAEPVLLNGGRWTIRARKAGFADAEDRVDVSGGTHRSVRLVLSRSAVDVPLASVAPASSSTAARPAALAPDAASSSPASRTPSWIGVGVTGALAASATITGVMALGAKSDYDDAVGRLGTTAHDVSSARDKTRTLALATDVLAGAAVASAVVTIVLFVTNASSRKADAGAGTLVNALRGRGTF